MTISRIVDTACIPAIRAEVALMTEEPNVSVMQLAFALNAAGYSRGDRELTDQACIDWREAFELVGRES